MNSKSGISNAKYLDKDIYKKAKAEVDKDFKTHSAYKSMALVKKYKELGGKIDDSNKKNGTNTWLKEKWLNLTPYAEGDIKNKSKSPPCGIKGVKQKGPSICRPSKGKSKILVKDLNKTQIKKALEIKKKGKRITWKKL
jgi:hypothetical protein